MTPPTPAGAKVVAGSPLLITHPDYHRRMLQRVKSRSILRVMQGRLIVGLHTGGDVPLAWLNSLHLTVEGDGPRLCTAVLAAKRLGHGRVVAIGGHLGTLAVPDRCLSPRARLTLCSRLVPEAESDPILYRLREPAAKPCGPGGSLFHLHDHPAVLARQRDRLAQCVSIEGGALDAHGALSFVLYAPGLLLIEHWFRTLQVRVRDASQARSAYVSRVQKLLGVCGECRYWLRTEPIVDSLGRALRPGVVQLELRSSCARFAFIRGALQVEP